MNRNPLELLQQTNIYPFAFWSRTDHGTTALSFLHCLLRKHIGIEWMTNSNICFLYPEADVCHLDLRQWMSDIPIFIGVDQEEVCEQCLHYLQCHDQYKNMFLTPSEFHTEYEVRNYFQDHTLDVDGELELEVCKPIVKEENEIVCVQAMWIQKKRKDRPLSLKVGWGSNEIEARQSCIQSLQEELQKEMNIVKKLTHEQLNQLPHFSRAFGVFYKKNH